MDFSAIQELEDLENMLDELVELSDKKTYENTEPKAASPEPVKPPEKPAPEPVKVAPQMPAKKTEPVKVAPQMPTKKTEPVKAAPQMPAKAPEPVKVVPQMPAKKIEPVKVVPQMPVKAPEPVKVVPQMPAKKPEGVKVMPDMPAKQAEPSKVVPHTPQRLVRSESASKNNETDSGELPPPMKSDSQTGTPVKSGPSVVVPNERASVVVTPMVPSSSPAPKNFSRNSIINLETKGLQIMVEEEAEDEGSSHITSATTVMLDQKKTMLNNMERKASTTISDLNLKKTIASQNRDFEQAKTIEKQLEAINSELKKLEEGRQLIKKALKLERKLIELGVTNFDSKIVTTETSFQQQKEELERLRQEAAQNEDYEGAIKYKRQLEELENEHQGKIKHFKEEGLTNTQAIATREKKDKKVQVTVDPALYTAVRGGKLNELKRLLEQEKKDINSAHPDTGNTALHGAVTLGMDPIIEYLVEKGADLNAKNRRGQSPLHICIEKRNDKMTEKLIEAGADVYLEDNLGVTPFQVAGKVANYQLQLKEFLTFLKKKRDEEGQKMLQNTKMTSSSGVLVVEEAAPVEHVDFYLKGGEAKTLLVSERDTTNVILDQIAEKLEVLDLRSALELAESVMGTETALQPSDLVLARKDKWPNQKAQYCKYVIRLKRGTPATQAMKWKKLLYGKK